MDVQGVAYLYKKVVSPSLNVTVSNWQRQPHWRHVNEYQKQDKLLKVGRQVKSPSPTRSVVSCPGSLETTDQSTSQAVTVYKDKEQSDQPDDYEAYNFRPTTRFTTLSLPAMPLTKRYTPSPTGTHRSVPLSSSRHVGVSQRSWASETYLASSQRERIQEEEKKKEHCRKLKRTSEMVKHRIDKQYYMAGARIPIQNKYHVDSGELLKLRLLANQRQLSAYKSVKDTDINPRESPSGQMSTPTPGGARKHGSVAPSGSTEPQSAGDGKWAEGQSETSSVDEFDSVSVRGQMGGVSGGISSTYNEKDRGAKSAESQTDQGPVNRTYSQNENDHRSLETEESIHGSSQTKSEAGEVTSKQVEKKKHSATKSVKKGRIRFKDEERAKAVKGKSTDEKGDAKEKDEKDEDQSGAEKGERRNKYMDEWLGLKPKEPEDERYKPGKPPPNRIFVSSDPGKAKERKHKKSAVFLTEITELKFESEDAALNPESYGIISSQQKQAFGSIYDEIDKDKNGSVTLEELKQRMRPSVTRHDIKHFLQVFDLNRDKTVDKREFTAICALNDRIAGSRTESQDASLALDLENLAQNIVIFKEMFKTIDEDDDNRLDAFELLVMVSAAMETEIGADLNLAKHVLEGARDEFGFIDFIGFLSYLPFFAKLIQTIMQHPLSITDIEQARERVKQKELTFTPKAKPKGPKSWEVY